MNMFIEQTNMGEYGLDLLNIFTVPQLFEQVDGRVGSIRKARRG